MCEITCPCNRIPEQIYNFNVFHLKSKFRGKEVVKFYDHEGENFYYQCEDMRVGASTIKEAFTLFRGM